MFEPIAITGTACVLPGANSVAELWRAVVGRQDVTTETPPGLWGAGTVRVLGAKSPATVDAVASARGGYVAGFDDRFDPDGFGLPVDRVRGLDSAFRWLMHCGREALAAGKVADAARPRTGLIVGNLSYPSRGLADFACETWLEDAGRPATGATLAENRFVSGLPAQLTARALRLGGPVFALDAACASSLYAMKLACDLLHDRKCDAVLAGGLNHADDLFLHVGFSTLSALSATGRSRPLTRNADGLLPAEGAALLVLKRLDDALAAGDRILGVIRGVGLSNDGSERGLLAPDTKGQTRAMRRAYGMSGVDPASIGFVECHATGTTAGDSEEVASMAAIFAGVGDLPVGALKGNLGHLITASGAASVLKILGAFESGLLPPTIDAEQPIEVMRSTPMRLLAGPEPWRSDRPRMAAVNAFGFGGNNAHLILEEPPSATTVRSVSVMPPRPPADDIAVCGIGVAIGDSSDLGAFVTRLRQAAGGAGDARIAEIRLPGRGLRFPPKDLRRSLGQQTLAMQVAFEALDGVKPFDPMDCGVFFGIGCDPEVARWGLRWRLPELAAGRGVALDEATLQVAREAAATALDSAAVVGTMPNIPANRLSTQFDFRGPAFTVSAEELSGVEALRIACHALACGEIGTALVGAADLSDEPVHRRAAKALLPAEHQQPADGAVALVLKRKSDAEAAGDRILALISADLCGDAALPEPAATTAVRTRWGHAHAASGLLEVVAAMVETVTRTEIDVDGARPVIATPDRQARTIAVSSFAGPLATVSIRAAEQPVTALARRSDGPMLRCWGAGSISDLAAAIDAPTMPAAAGWPVRLAIVARNDEDFRAKLDACRIALMSGRRPEGRGIHFGEGEALGEAAIVFAGANAYPDVGRGFFLAFPEIADALAGRFAVAGTVARDLYGPNGHEFVATPFGALKASSLLGQGHALAAERLLGFRPPVAMGLSSGETNSLFAFGVWRDMTAMFAALEQSGLYDTHLAGRLQAARTHWALPADRPLRWKSWLVSAPVAEVAERIEGIERVEISIVLSPQSCIVSGPEEACAAAIERIGRDRVIEQTPTLICHSAVLGPFAGAWTAIHDRETHPRTDVRFYSQSHNGAYAPTRSTIRDALLDQALRPIDFGATIDRAWRDGVRIFVEAGPRNILSRSIAETLGSRPHLTVALDDGGRDPVEHLAGVAARLFAAGAPIDPAALARTFDRPTEAADGIDRLTLSLPARMPAFAPEILAQPPSATTEPVKSGSHAVTTLADALPSRDPPEAPYVFSRARPHREAEIHHIGPVLTSEPPTPAAEILPPPYSRTSLETLAGGRISEVFGQRFAAQDGYLRQVRMPMPPLLLADRIVTIEGEPGVLGTGRIVTETDIRADAWYLDDGRMPTGLLIESGQADLLLISWMGIDAANRDDRVYRLLGCEITFHDGGMPKVGDTLRFDIRINGHAQLGDVRMFFFEYDCSIGDRLVSSVRNGQAGFFTDAELAAAKGVNWTPPAPLSEGRAALPESLRPSGKRAFSAAELAALSAGDALTCFGPGFELAAAHQRTPRLPDGRMRLIDEVVRFDPEGGPRGLGYLEARATVPEDAWFYSGHFHNDPCMPGTLMADAAVQCLGFTMAAMGMTVRRDGWRFEPIVDEPFKFVCRGQVVPDRVHELRYEVFVTEIEDGPTPTIHATLLCSSDGLKVFHCQRFGLRLVPDWPLSTRQEWLARAEPPRRLRDDGDVRGDFTAMLACAWDRPSIPFGKGYERFDREGRVPRLPGPPYLFMSRVTDVSEPAWKGEPGVTMTSEYDLPADAWFFTDNDRPTMPYCVLAEVMLQPCGWLASYVGLALSGNAYYRNLDGNDAIQHIDITPDLGTLRVRATLTRIVRLGALALAFFRSECHAGDRLVCSLETSFGLFTAAELSRQAGLTVTPEARAQLTEPSSAFVDLRSQPAQFFAGPLQLPRGRLRMIDEVTGYWPATPESPGRIRCRQAVDPHAWYFKAHFYEDPVQPGSLGLDALLQTVKAYLILAGHGRDFATLRCEPIALGEALTWKYRGQVVPINKEVVTSLSVTVTETAEGVLAVAEGTLWADGLPIYEVKNMGVRLVATAAPVAHRVTAFTPDAPDWVADHCPTYSVPALPMTALVAEVVEAARSAAGKNVTSIESLLLRRWTPVPADGVRLVTELRASAGGYDAAVSACYGREDRPLKAVRHEVATGRVTISDAHGPAPAPWSPLGDLVPVADPYAAGNLFHGPAFHLQTALRRSTHGASAEVTVPSDVGIRDADRMVLLLDAALHGVPHDEPERWLGETAAGFVGYPEELVALRFFSALPCAGTVRVETRPVAQSRPGTLGVRTQIVGDGGVIAEMEHVERLVAKGPLGNRRPADRRRFLAERRFVAGMGLSQHDGGESRLRIADIQRSNWLPGTVEHVYDVTGPIPELAAAIAVKEHFAAQFGVHPSRIAVEGGAASCPQRPFRRHRFAIRHEPGVVVVSSEGAETLSTAAVARALSERLGIRPSIATTFHAALVGSRFGSIEVAEAAWRDLTGEAPAVLLIRGGDGPTQLAVAATVAALTGRRSRLVAGGGGLASGVELAHLLSAYPASLHDPLLDAADPGATPSETLRSAVAAGRFVLAFDPDPALESVLKSAAETAGVATVSIDATTGTLAIGAHAGRTAVPATSGAPEVDLWTRTVARVASETGFDLGAPLGEAGGERAARPPERIRAWIERLSRWRPASSGAAAAIG
ncbi:MAG: polyketide synthase dehydratase domain-containing protein [Bauldia sp.]|nr:polyketide synthase dehydratase domain-containing protein [Bauldia sp.]